MIIKIDLEKLSQVFPDYIEKSLKKNKNKTNLVEIVMDLGRRPEGRFLSGSEYLSEQVVSWQDLDYTAKRLGRFSKDNRAGIERSLHRISCIRNRQGHIIGLTCRIGRCVLGSIGMVRDLLDFEESLLILGRPGLGKTTLIREISRLLSEEVEKRVVIVDTANEIAGNSDIPHVGIGRARRMQVSSFENQHNLMIEAIENHMPEVIVVDEIGTELEALAAQTIAERGVQLVGTAHGNSLENLIKNPTLSDLVGGIHSVTLSDEEARKRKSQKSILERKSLPAFPMAIELNHKSLWTIHEKVEQSVDTLLKKQVFQVQSRSFPNKKLLKIENSSLPSTKNSVFYLKSLADSAVKKKPKKEKIKVFASQKPRKKKKRKKKTSKLLAFQALKKPFAYLSFLSWKPSTKLFSFFNQSFSLTQDYTKADVFFLSKKDLRQNQRLQKWAQKRKIPIYLMQRPSMDSWTKVVQHLKSAYVA